MGGSCDFRRREEEATWCSCVRGDLWWTGATGVASLGKLHNRPIPGPPVALLSKRQHHHPSTSPTCPHAFVLGPGVLSLFTFSLKNKKCGAWPRCSRPTAVMQIRSARGRPCDQHHTRTTSYESRRSRASESRLPVTSLSSTNHRHADTRRGTHRHDAGLWTCRPPRLRPRRHAPRNTSPRRRAMDHRAFAHAGTRRGTHRHDAGLQTSHPVPSPTPNTSPGCRSCASAPSPAAARQRKLRMSPG